VVKQDDLAVFDIDNPQWLRGQSIVVAGEHRNSSPRYLRGLSTVLRPDRRSFAAKFRLDGLLLATLDNVLSTTAAVTAVDTFLEVHMRVSRSGASRNRGTTVLMDNVSLTPNMASDIWYWSEKNVRWDARTKELQLAPRNIPLGDGRTHHNYSLSFTMEDISAFLAVLGHVASASDAQLLRDQLGKDVPALVKMLSCANGIAPMPMPEPSAATATVAAAG
jgi:hypothetical protein